MIMRNIPSPSFLLSRSLFSGGENRRIDFRTTLGGLTHCTQTQNINGNALLPERTTNGRCNPVAMASWWMGFCWKIFLDFSVLVGAGLFTYTRSKKRETALETYRRTMVAEGDSTGMKPVVSISRRFGFGGVFFVRFVSDHFNELSGARWNGEMSNACVRLV